MASFAGSAAPEVTLTFADEKRTVSVSFHEMSENDFEHLRKPGNRWMRLSCYQNGQRSNQVVHADIPLSSVIFYARKLIKHDNPRPRY